jgi:probable phosphoglycerate mutase
VVKIFIMPVLLLIRHATNDFVKTGRLPGQTPNIHLNEEGRKQAEALGELLKKRPLDAVYSSQLERAIETAWRVAQPHGLSIFIRPALADINNGDFTGLEIKKLGEDEATKELWKVVVETPSLAKFPNGEAMLDMQQRVITALETIIAAHPDVALPPETEKPEARGQNPDTAQTASNSPSGAQSQQPATNEQPKKRPQVVAVVAHADVIKAALANYLGMPFDLFQRVGVSPASISTVMIMTDDKTGEQHIMVNHVNQVPYQA